MSEEGFDPGGTGVAVEELEAMGDAVADMEGEGEELTFGFFVSYMVWHPERPPEHGIVRVTAPNYREAGWMAYVEVQEEYPADAGWMPPSIIVDEEPFLLVPGLPHPVVTVSDDEEVPDVK